MTHSSRPRRRRWTTGLAAAAAGLTAVASGSTSVRAAPETPTATLTTVAEASGAVDLAWRSGDPALYVVEQRGRILQLVGGTTTPVLDIGGEIVAGGEQGLLGLAFSPDGTHAYVNYTEPGGDTVIAEMTVSADGLAFDGANRRVLLTIDQPYGNHNGGDLAFGPDGMLYIGMGDGGSGGDPQRYSLDPGSLLGKMLRIDPTPSSDLPYTIPADNPFVGQDGARPEIWSTGLRNPWRFSFDPATGDLWIADVGQGAVEEVSVAPAVDGLDAGRGANFGWSAYEGDREFNSDQLDLVDEHLAPIHTYGHDVGCSISGGARARGAGAGGLDGWYVFADYCAGEIWALLPADDLGSAEVVTIANAGSGVTAVTTGPDGAVYVLNGSSVQVLSPV